MSILKKRLRLDITHRYQLFFFLTAILPVLLFSIILLEYALKDINHNLASLLDSGVRNVEDAIQDNHRELFFSARQAAQLSINDKFHEYLRTGDDKRFRLLMTRYSKTNRFSIVIVTDRKGRVLFSDGQSQPYNRISMATKINACLKGKSVTGFERFRTDNDAGLHLAYVAAAPIPKIYQSAQTDGVLFVGRFLKDDASLRTLKQVFPRHRFGIFVQTPSGFHADFAEGSRQKRDSPSRETLLRIRSIHKTKSTTTDKTTAYEDRLNGKPVLSRLAVLRNQQNQPIGFIRISVPKTLWSRIAQENAWAITVFAALLFLWLALAGRWFRRDVIDPMSALTLGLKRVAEGDLSTRLHLDSNHHAEALNTLSGFNHLVSRLEESDKLRSTFISTLSHDLKTPLIAQKRVAEILLSRFVGQPDSETRLFLEGLHKSNSDLLDMVITLLDTYRFEDGQITLSPDRVDLRDKVNRCLDSLRSLAENAGVSLQVSIPETFGPIQADRVQLRRVIINLVGNAIQNIPEGSTVNISATRVDGLASLVIEDNGPGLPTAIRDRLFERYNTGPSLTKRIGSGLGLFICRMIIECHGGTIHAESVLGEGTRFVIRLPDPVHSITSEND